MTEYTPAQLEAWAGLGPWCQPDGPEYGVMLDRVPSRPIHSFLGQPIFDKQPHDDWFEQEMANATLIAAAPDLARLVLEKEKEIARLKAVTNITPAMFEAAIEAWFKVVEAIDSRTCYGVPVPPENLHDALIAALEAALDKLTGEK